MQMQTWGRINEHNMHATRVFSLRTQDQFVIPVPRTPLGSVVPESTDRIGISNVA